MNANTETMQAAVCTRYGPPEVLVLRQVPKPVPKASEVRIKIVATSVTGSDCIIRSLNASLFYNMLMRVVIGFRGPRNPILGMVLSGVVDAVGENVTLFEPGDAVFAYGVQSSFQLRFGTYAEYKCLPEQWNLARKPANMTHEQAAAIPYGGMLGMYYVEKAHVQPGHAVLVYGASGSIGTMMIQLLKNKGATVTAVCSARNIDMVKSLGADHVIDYTADDAMSMLETYDVVFDAAGKAKSSPVKVASADALKPGGKAISVDDGSPATPKANFLKLKALAEAGKLAPVIDRTFPLEAIVEAHRYVDGGHKRGNVIITVSDG